MFDKVMLTEVSCVVTIFRALRELNEKKQQTDKKNF
jgi:hypothetical protein